MNWRITDISAYTTAEYADAYRTLSASRKARIDRFKRQEDRIRSLAGEILVRRLICETYSVDSCIPACLENGMPYLPGAELFISISHCGSKVACAVSDKPIGIDIEQVRPVDLRMTRRVCTQSEARYVFGGEPSAEQLCYCEDTAILKRFFEIWTGKEAYFKKQGTGITEFKSIDILTLERHVVYEDPFIIQMI